jgi:hypothetical protein
MKKTNPSDYFALLEEQRKLEEVEQGLDWLSKLTKWLYRFLWVLLILMAIVQFIKLYKIYG